MASSDTSRAAMRSTRESPRTGSAAAPVSLPRSLGLSPGSPRVPTLAGQLSSSSLNYNRSDLQAGLIIDHPTSPGSLVSRRRRSHSGEGNAGNAAQTGRSPRKSATDVSTALAKAQSRNARKINDAMVYLDGPQIYTCAQCRTHLTSHDEIISKSFHGRHGRAYLFDNCVNVTVGRAEDRLLITGLHSVCDIFCKRCKNMVGWTYAKAYEQSQKYKEGKYIIEKINLHLEESDYYDVAPPAGERRDRFRARSISWGSESSASLQQEQIYEYRPSSPQILPRLPREHQTSAASMGSGSGPASLR